MKNNIEELRKNIGNKLYINGFYVIFTLNLYK